MIKILHIADCHLDSPLNGLPARISNRRRHETVSALSDAFSYASENGVNLILISGDLFDTPKATQSSLNLITAFAKNNPNMRIFISSGNHDCALGNNYIPILSLVPNIHIFAKGEIEKVELPEINTCVYGLGCVQPHSEARLLQNFWAEDVGKINIMCFHGLLQGFGGHAPYNPVTKKDIAQSGLDYLALGHVHTYSGIMSLGLVNYAYSGCLLGRGFDETGKKGFIVGEIDKEYCKLEFIESAYPSFERVFVDCTGAQDTHEIINKAKEALKAIDDNCFVSIILEGYIRSDLVLNRSVVSTALDRFAFIKIEDKTRPARDYVSLANEQSLKGIFIKSVLESGNDEQTIQKAISLGLAALSGEELTMDEY